MTRIHTPAQKLKEAKQIALDHGMFVVEKKGAYLLYRKTPVRNVFLGRRTQPDGIRSLVTSCVKTK